MSATPYLSEICLFSFVQVPKGWLPCDGRSLLIETYRDLFMVLGTLYGGDGKTNFSLPDLRGGTPMHRSDQMPLGQRGGEAAHSLTISEMPGHSHMAYASSDTGNTSTPANHYWSSYSGTRGYSDSKNAQMADHALTSAGRGLPHDNMAPYLGLNICIAVTGKMPQSF
ncbi:MAG TPA: tail fiber protein [Puia sp.]|nr:tail fiber protein [Puia sp.]